MIQSTKARFSLIFQLVAAGMLPCWLIITKIPKCICILRAFFYYKSPGFTLFLFTVWNCRNIDWQGALIVLAVACIWVYSNLSADKPCNTHTDASIQSGYSFVSWGREGGAVYLIVPQAKCCCSFWGGWGERETKDVRVYYFWVTNLFCWTLIQLWQWYGSWL